MKDFKTYEEQIKLLESRGLIVADKKYATNFLIENNYYNVINAYKAIFIDPNQSDERYIPKARFEGVAAIWQFDKALSALLFKEIIRIERTFKSIIAYEFSKRYTGLGHENFMNFEIASPYIELSKLIVTLNRKVEERKRINSMVEHHLKDSNGVPLWALVNILSFGDISKFFSLMKPSDQNAVSVRFGQLVGKVVKPKELKNYIKILVFVRNLCAHDQRVYDFNSKLNIKPNHFLNKKLNYNKTTNDLFAVFASIASLSTDDVFNSFASSFAQCYDTLLSKATALSATKINNAIGFPANWKEMIPQKED